MTVPQPIRAALSRCDPVRPIGILMPLARGQIRCMTQGLQPEDLRERLVLVLRVDELCGFAEIMFVHPYTELATGSDLIVSPEYSGIAYQVVVETDVRGVVWLTQLGTLIGVLDPTALVAVGAVALGEDPDTPNLISGPPLRGRFDARWNFKASEGSALRTLAAECTAALLDEQDCIQLDVGGLSPALLAAISDREKGLLKLLDIISRGDVVLDLNDIAMLEEIGALEVANWIDVFGDIGREHYESMVRPLIEPAISKPSRSNSTNQHNRATVPDLIAVA